jgi:aerobic-type carbon monoxide dehydrogenase small subunit (CoxS/CutS family)
MSESISFILNGRQVTVPVDGSERLIDVLRERLGRTEVKEGCGEGECGACTILLDGQPVTSCILFAWQVAGRSVTTVAGLSDADKGRIQAAMMAAGAVQCGFCTPGFVLTIKALLDANPSPTREETLHAISGNLCRCTGYEKIVDAVDALAEGGRQ